LSPRQPYGRSRVWGRDMSRLIKRSFSLAGHRTSVALEREFWAALLRMAEARDIPLSTLVARIDAERDPDRPLASALRVSALQDLNPSR